MIWLKTFDCRPISSGKPLYLFTSTVLKGGACGADWKINISFSDLAVSLGELVGEQIKTASQRVDDSTGLRIDETRDRLNLSDVPNILAGLRIFVSRDGVWTTVDPARNPFVENIELAYGPIDTSIRI
jgi:hypothetical protein